MPVLRLGGEAAEGDDAAGVAGGGLEGAQAEFGRRIVETEAEGVDGVLEKRRGVGLAERGEKDLFTRIVEEAGEGAEAGAVFRSHNEAAARDPQNALEEAAEEGAGGRRIVEPDPAGAGLKGGEDPCLKRLAGEAANRNGRICFGAEQRQQLPEEFLRRALRADPDGLDARGGGGFGDEAGLADASRAEDKGAAAGCEQSLKAAEFALPSDGRKQRRCAAAGATGWKARRIRTFSGHGSLRRGKRRSGRCRSWVQSPE